MSTGRLVLLTAYGLVLLVWIVRLFILSKARRKLVVLARPRSGATGRSGTGDPPVELPSVSVLVPARDEEKTIGGCLRSLLALDYPRLDILVLDDRSTDRTAAIVREWAGQDARVRLLQIQDLPPGWTGKNHALHQGVKHTHGDWLLFVDADTLHDPANLRVLLNYAEQEQADMVTLLPRLGCHTWPEKIIQPLAGIMLLLLFRLSRVNSDRHPSSAFANGQYLLVRRTAYDQVGGHAAVRNQLVEDIQLARRFKQAGLRLRVVLAPELTTTRMYSSLAEILSGWSRIYYAAVDHRPWKLLALLAAMSVFTLSAYAALGFSAALLLGGDRSAFTWTLAGMTAAHFGMMLLALRTLYGFTLSRRRYLWGHPLACLGMVVVLLRAIGTCFTHRISWRGTAYGPELRK
jgi:cellulose synthase/poly-beta-1,6-N-acetylglucosamine synthase-like glycosyltransferase